MRLLCALMLAVAAAGNQSETVYPPGNGVSLPQVVKEVRPEYTSEAMQQRIEGKVLLAVVVAKDGSVADVKVSRSLDAVCGLDTSAVEAAKQWTFKPGLKDGKPVAVSIHVEMAFTLK
jgi:TonB family protein